MKLLSTCWIYSFVRDFHVMRRLMFPYLLMALAAGCGGGASSAPPSGLTYATPQTFTTGVAITALTPTVTGKVKSYSVSPALPPGLSLKATTGQISGTPSVVATEAVFVVTAANSSGSTTFSLHVTVNPPAPSALRYTSPNTFTNGATITPLTPTVVGTVENYSVSPALPPGLELNAASGQISGTLTNTAAQATYTITAQNAGGSTTFGLVITVIDVIVSGRITFDFVPHDPATDGLAYANTVAKPARGITVQAIRVSDGSVMSASKTDANGMYSLSSPPNTMMNVRMRAEMVKTGPPTWNVIVVDNTATDALYTGHGADFNSGTADVSMSYHFPSGFNSAGTVTKYRLAAPFAILDSIYQALNKVLISDSAAVFPPLVLHWSTRNKPAGGGNSTATRPCSADGQIGTSYYIDGHICIVGAANIDTDEYDDHVIVHEWAHYFEDKFSRSESIGGSHSGGDRLDMRVAFGEGFGNAWSGIVTDNPVYRDSSGDSQSEGFAINVDNNTNTNPGWFSEDSIQSILYDLYDSSNDGTDTVALGVGPMLSVMRGAQRTGPAFTSIFSFVSALKTANPASASAISTLVNAQGIVGSTIDAYGSTESFNAGNMLDVLPIYTDVSLNGGTRQVCKHQEFGEGNKLSVSRFLKFPLAAERTVTFRVTGGTDPDFLFIDRLLSHR